MTLVLVPAAEPVRAIDRASAFIADWPSSALDDCGFVFAQGLHGLNDGDVAGYVARARDFFAGYAEPVEWKS